MLQHVHFMADNDHQSRETFEMTVPVFYTERASKGLCGETLEL